METDGLKMRRDFRGKKLPIEARGPNPPRPGGSHVQRAMFPGNLYRTFWERMGQQLFILYTPPYLLTAPFRAV